MELGVLSQENSFPDFYVCDAWGSEYFCQDGIGEVKWREELGSDRFSAT